MVEASKINPWNVNSPYGNVFFDPATRQISYQQFDNPFYNMLSQGGMAGFSNAFTAPGSPYYGASPEIVAAMEGLQTQNLQDDAQNRYSLLSQLAQPEQQRSFNNLQDTLYARGQLGTSGGGIQQEAFQNAANRADLERQLASQDWATQRAQNRFASALQAVQSGQQGANNQFTMGTNSLIGMDNIFSQLASTAGQGVAAGGGAPAGPLMQQYQASNQMPAAIYGSLQNSGLLDAFSGWAGNKMSGWFGGGGSGMSDAAVRAAVPLNLSFSGMKF